ncbi:hypothetical protein [Desulforhopalus vacuolatus]|uniref:hypothetical protein n=1 Tax=Desulforhopalus vacuolatus TaxID=40414 RepID=UPI001F053DB0|nr:hypothetical protein [Desulforhopalus vacuolatus]
MEIIFERENMRRALKQVRSNKGAPGIDGMTVDQLPSYLRRHWEEIGKRRLRRRLFLPEHINRYRFEGRKSQNHREALDYWVYLQISEDFET